MDNRQLEWQHRNFREQMGHSQPTGTFIFLLWKFLLTPRSLFTIKQQSGLARCLVWLKFNMRCSKEDFESIPVSIKPVCLGKCVANKCVCCSGFILRFFLDRIFSQRSSSLNVHELDMNVMEKLIRTWLLFVWVSYELC